jgi:uncharacterized protein YdcH (DUF465 family)
MDLHHPLTTEFPEYRNIITTLNVKDGYFHSLLEEYDRIDDEICRIEENLQWATDQEIEELKLRRVYLKDKLYRLVRLAPAAAA